MNIKEITSPERNAQSIISDLKYKTVSVKPWALLRKEYEPKEHPVMTDKTYKDKVTKRGIEKVTRYTLGLQKLAVKRMTELMFAFPCSASISRKTTKKSRLRRLWRLSSKRTASTA